MLRFHPLGDPCAWFAPASNLAVVEFIDGERRWTGSTVAKAAAGKGIEWRLNRCAGWERLRGAVEG